MKSKTVISPLQDAAGQSTASVQAAGDLITKSAMTATHAALLLARGAVATADKAVQKYLPVRKSGTAAKRRLKSKAKTVRAKAKRTVKRASSAAKTAARKTRKTASRVKRAAKRR